MYRNCRCFSSGIWVFSVWVNIWKLKLSWDSLWLMYSVGLCSGLLFIFIMVGMRLFMWKSFWKRGGRLVYCVCVCDWY